MDATVSQAFNRRSGSLSRTERQYRYALRHSRRVRRLKIALPLASGLLIFGFFALSWIGTSLPEGVSIESTAIEGGKIVMRSPVMTGETGSGQPYSMRAAKAIQDLTTPDLIELEEITANIPVSADLMAKLVASRGLYNRTAETMVLNEPFEVETSKGMKANLKSAEIDMNAGTVATREPVSVATAEMSVVADSMRILDKGRSILFQDNVRMTIDPSALNKAKPEAAAAN